MRKAIVFSLSCVALTSLIAVSVAACSSSDAPIGIDVTVGQETGAFADAGVSSVTLLITSPIDTTLKISESASVDGGTFDFGDLSDSEQITVQATASNASGVVMTGQSLEGLLLSDIAGDLPVFIQQRGHWARPPGGFACSHVGGVASVQDNRAFILTNGTLPKTGNASGCDATAIDTYDMFGLGGDVPTPAYSTPAPTSIVSLLPSTNSDDSQGLFITSVGGTFWDYDTAQTNTTCPANFTAWSTVAGGAAIADTDTGTDAGTWFVVGGTRSSGATAGVLEVGADCTTTGLTLNSPRAGAAAAWISGFGLVVVGGQPSSSTGAGIEILTSELLTDGDTTFMAQCPADHTVGAAIVPDGSSGIMRVGGTLDGQPAPTVHFGLSGDTSACAAVPYALTSGSPALPTLTNVTAFPLLASNSSLVIGTDPTGMIATFILTTTIDAATLTVTPVPLQEPRRGATTIYGPTNAIAMLGGEHVDGTPATSIELFVP